MTQDDVICMANSINEDWWLDDMDLEAFAKLVAAAEREACAKVCDEWESDEAFVANIAEEIRARGKL